MRFARYMGKYKKWRYTMKESCPKLHPFCFPDMEEAFAKSAVREIAPDVWQIEGFAGFSFFLAPPSSNVYILRDGDIVFMLDSGMQPFYRQRILDVLRKYSAAGCSTLVLMDTQGHWDHALNNDVVLDAGFKTVRFLLPEPEVPVIDCAYHWLGDFRKLEAFYNPYESWRDILQEIERYARNFKEYEEPQYALVWKYLSELRPDSSYEDYRMALKLLTDRVLVGNKRNLAERAEILPLSSREKRTFGDTEFMGWQVGRFFVIHDGSHSPGHVCLYDPQNRLLLSGDVTVEINPPFFDSSFEKCITAARGLRRMAEQGFVELASDAHRSKAFFKDAMSMLNIEVLNPVQLEDCARGEDECIAFFSTFEKYYSGLRRDVLETHARLGEATVKQIVEELFKLDTPEAKFKKSLPFPSRPNVLVTRILDENGYRKRVSGDKILFSPKEPWRFA
jgi:glyoxylase-like metal-dependent hydrolase (beta-lactamase superfamily II)